jgi:hypothetical protein
MTLKLGTADQPGYLHYGDAWRLAFSRFSLPPTLHDGVITIPAADADLIQ